MKHIFIVNPKSGKKDSTDYISQYLKENFSDLNYELYNTKCVGDAMSKVKEFCETKEEPLTFYAFLFSASTAADSFFQVVAMKPIAIIQEITQEIYTPFQPKLLLI